jgi:hypothetical protein
MDADTQAAEDIPGPIALRAAAHLDVTHELFDGRERERSLSGNSVEQHRTALPTLSASRRACDSLRGTMLSSIAPSAAEQIIFILIITQFCIIVTETSLGFETIGRSLVGPAHWTTYTLVVIFALFTMELCTKVALFGLLLNRDGCVRCE